MAQTLLSVLARRGTFEQINVAQTLLSVLARLGTFEQINAAWISLTASHPDTSILSFANGTSSRPGIPSSTVSQKYAA